MLPIQEEKSDGSDKSIGNGHNHKDDIFPYRHTFILCKDALMYGKKLLRVVGRVLEARRYILQ